MNTVTPGPGAVAEAVQGAFQHVARAVQKLETTLLFGTAEERGHALGELGADIILGVAGGEAAVAAKATLEGIAATLTEAGATKALGTALNRGMRASEALAPELAAIEKKIVEEAPSVIKSAGRAAWNGTIIFGKDQNQISHLFAILIPLA